MTLPSHASLRMNLSLTCSTGISSHLKCLICLPLPWKWAHRGTQLNGIRNEAPASLCRLVVGDEQRSCPAYLIAVSLAGASTVYSLLIRPWSSSSHWKQNLEAKPFLWIREVKKPAGKPLTSPNLRSNVPADFSLRPITSLRTPLRPRTGTLAAATTPPLSERLMTFSASSCSNPAASR